MAEKIYRDEIVALTTDVVSAFVSSNAVAASEIPSLIAAVNDVLLRTSKKALQPPMDPLTPAVSIKKSVTPDFIICLEDGLKFKSLKRHIKTSYDLTPEQYREKWGLPNDYPMVAPNYAAARSALAKKAGFGCKKK